MTILRGHGSVEKGKLAAAIPCGSELARDGGVSVGFNVECAMAIASKLAPTGGHRDSAVFQGRTLSIHQIFSTGMSWTQRLQHNRRSVSAGGARIMS
jgi:hypothetical protein